MTANDTSPPASRPYLSSSPEPTDGLSILPRNIFSIAPPSFPPDFIALELSEIESRRQTLLSCLHHQNDCPSVCIWGCPVSGDNGTDNDFSFDLSSDCDGGDDLIQQLRIYDVQRARRLLLLSEEMTPGVEAFLRERYVAQVGAAYLEIEDDGRMKIRGWSDEGIGSLGQTEIWNTRPGGIMRGAESNRRKGNEDRSFQRTA